MEKIAYLRSKPTKLAKQPLAKCGSGSNMITFGVSDVAFSNGWPAPMSAGM